MSLVNSQMMNHHVKNVHLVNIHPSMVLLHVNYVVVVDILLVIEPTVMYVLLVPSLKQVVHVKHVHPIMYH